MFLKGIVVNVREIDIVELHAAQLLELFLDAAAHFKGKLEDLFKLFLRELPVRIKQLDHSANHLANGNGIALIEVLAKAEILVQRIAVLLLAKLTDELCQIVGDEAVVVGEMLRTELRYLPAGNIAVHTVEKRRVRSHFRRERVKETGCFQQHIHALIDVADENHRSGRGFFFLSTSKGAGRHIVLHDLNAVLVLEVDTGNLVERHAIPQANQANGFSAHVVEQVRNGSLTAGNKDAVRGDFFVDMGFAGASRT